MTRKDYVTVARIIARGTIIKNDKPSAALDKDYIVQQLSNYFQKDNPRFIEDKFAMACYREDIKGILA